MKYSFLFFTFFIIVPFTQAQVNTERYYQDYQTKGYMFSNAFGFNFASGNTQYFELSNTFRGDYNGEREDYMLIAEYTYKTSKGVKAANKGFLHLRSFQQIGYQHFFQTEEYTQLEFNEFLLLRSRFLLGGGFRFDPVALADSAIRSKNTLKAFVGTGLFYEFERYSTDPVETYHHLRWSSYLSLVWAVNPHTGINLVNYIQPVPSDFSNFRYYSTLSLSTMLTGKLYYDLAFNFYNRSKPVGGKKSIDLEARNTFRYKF
ncbi:MAG: DUF481 domain-containing protein [Bacteroidales bacterium]|nr:DUF481 domain-containing protein [Bacteroidales bacterium]